MPQRLPCILCLALCLNIPGHCGGQIAELVYQTPYRLDTTRTGQLAFELDNLNFAKNNEYQGDYQKGYTLPGLWVQPKLTYQPLKNLKVELGGHFLLYHGANKYPAVAYTDIAAWKGDQYQQGSHILPFFRAQADLSDHLTLVMGNLYGGANHQLIEPLYNPELNLTCDPETGLQLLFSWKHLTLDIWGNWQSFIFREDTHQEVFTIGLSARFRLNAPDAPVHLYLPLQVLAQHRGGEIDTIYTNSVQTLLNGATGLAAVWNTHTRWLQHITAEAHCTLHWQQAGTLWPFDQGYALHARLSAQLTPFSLKAGYYQSHRFISLFGNPFFGSLSTRHEGATLSQPRLLYYGATFSRPLGKGFALGADIDLFHTLRTTLTHTDGTTLTTGPNLSFSAGVYLRIHPSILIKQF